MEQTENKNSAGGMLQGAASLARAGMKAGIPRGAAATALAGPWGAAASAAWESRHALYRLLCCAFIGMLLLSVAVASLPSVLTNSLSGAAGIQEGYAELAQAVQSVIDSAHDGALAEVETRIGDGGYDYRASMEELDDQAQGSAGMAACHILAAYSVSMGRDASLDDMARKLEAVKDKMFAVTGEERTKERTEPVAYETYKEKAVTAITAKEENGEGAATYQTGERTYYVKDGRKMAKEETVIDTYKEVAVEVPVYDESGNIVATKEKTFYEKDGEETVRPETEAVRLLACTIHPFDEGVIEEAFGIDMDAAWQGLSMTCREAAQAMAGTLRSSLYGAANAGTPVSLTDRELAGFVDAQGCSGARKRLLSTALALVGQVPYFWGGKSGPGWNSEWNTPKLVTAAGSPSTGTIRPYGLDCSGFTAWVYATALGASIGAGTGGQYRNTVAVSERDLLPGDLGFHGSGGGWSHVLMFAGRDGNGNGLWVHCSSSGNGVVLNTPSYAGSLSLRRPTGIDLESDSAGGASGTGTGAAPIGEPLGTIEVDVTHYCSCAKCCGKWANGRTASGKQAAYGMVAMSSRYPFGTRILINGEMFTVEDRGGSGIENDPHRVDVYVDSHEQALRMGRYRAQAQIYAP